MQILPRCRVTFARKDFQFLLEKNVLIDFFTKEIFFSLKLLASLTFLTELLGDTELLESFLYLGGQWWAPKIKAEGPQNLSLYLID